MSDHIEFPMQVGEAVEYDGHSEGVSGVVVEQLSNGYVRVKWEDLKVPTTHRQTSLRRQAAAARMWH